MIRPVLVGLPGDLNKQVSLNLVNYKMSVVVFCQVIREVGKSVGIEPLIIQGEELDKQGFGGTCT